MIELDEVGAVGAEDLEMHWTGLFTAQFGGYVLIASSASKSARLV